MADEKTLTQRLESIPTAGAAQSYIGLKIWQIEEIQRAIGEADREEFASEAEVRKAARKWAR